MIWGGMNDLAPEALELVAQRFRVLADPLRLRLLQLLVGGRRNVTELTSRLATTQPNVSKQLRVLQQAGFVGRRAEGNNAYWFVADSSVFELCDLVCSRLQARLTSHARLLSPARRRKART